MVGYVEGTGAACVPFADGSKIAGAAAGKGCAAFVGRGGPPRLERAFR